MCTSSDKLGAKSEKSKFVGYPKKTVGYYLYNPTEQKVFISKHTTFSEKEFLLKRTNGSKIVFEEVQESQTDIPMELEPMVEALNS